MQGQTPSPRQIVFNWLFDEDLTQVGGYWGGYEEVENVDRLLAALGLPQEPIKRPITNDPR